jgi:hypothetical protein
MSSKQIRPSLRAMPLLLGLGVAGLAMGAGAASSSDEPLRCEIRANSMNGMIELQGVVHADVPVSGSYRFKVASAGGAGNTNMSQGGYFTAGPGEAAMLGRVMLGNAGAIYDATLEIESDGMTVECEERVGGAI